MDPTRQEIEDALRNADAAGDVEAARQLADYLAGLPEEPIVGIPLDKGDTIGPTKHRIAPRPEEGDLDLGSTVRAFGSRMLPGTDQLGGVGNYVGDRLPQALGGTPPGQERDFSTALEDYRLDRGVSEQEEPGASVLGMAYGAYQLPWPKGYGILKSAGRAVEAAGLTGVTEYLRGEDLKTSLERGAEAGALTLGVEGGLALPGAIGKFGKRVRRWAGERAWRAGSPTPTQAQAIAEALDSGAVSGKEIAGTFMRDAKLMDGTPVVQKDHQTTYRNLLKYIEEWGAKKGDLVRLADSKGAQVDATGVLQELDQILATLHQPEYQVMFPKAHAAAKEFRDSIEALYGLKPPQPVIMGGHPPAPAILGIPPGPSNGLPSPVIAQGGGVGAVPPLTPGGPMSFRPTAPPGSPAIPPSGPPGTAPPMPPAGPGVMAEAAEGSPLAATAMHPPVVQPSGYIHPNAQIPAETPTGIPGVPYGGQPPPFGSQAGTGQYVPLQITPPRTLEEWERLKTAIQTFVEDTRSGLNRPDAAISASPLLKTLQGFGSTVRHFGEDAARRVLTPEEFRQFMVSKRKYSISSEVEPAYRQSLRLEETARERSVGQDWRYFGHRLPWAFGLGAGGVAAASGQSLGRAVAAGVGGYGLSRAAQAIERADPMMTRVDDAVGRFLRDLGGPADASLKKVVPPWAAGATGRELEEALRSPPQKKTKKKETSK